MLVCWDGKLFLLEGRIDNVALLPSHRVVDRIDTRIVRDSLNNRLKSLLKLLIVQTLVNLLLTVISTKIETTKLLSSCSHIEKLLLKNALLLSKIGICSSQFFIDSWINVLIGSVIEIERGWSQDMLRK